MRKRIIMLGAASISCVVALGFGYSAITLADEGDVAINETNFPDSDFRDYVQKFDTNQDDVLSKSELNEVTSINLHQTWCESLKGIEYFTRLTTLDCSENSLKTLDVSENRFLEELCCSFNELLELDVTNNPNLRKLDFLSNPIGEVDVTRCKYLEAATRQLERQTYEDEMTVYRYYSGTVDVDDASVDVYIAYDIGVDLIWTYSISENPVAIDEETFPNSILREYVKGFDQDGDGFLNEDECNSVEVIDCSNEFVDDSGLHHDGRVSLRFFPNLLKLVLDFPVEGEKYPLNISRNTDLVKIYARSMRMPDMDFSHFTDLEILDCGDCKIGKVDVSGCEKLESIYFHACEIPELIWGTHPYLTNVDISENRISNLIISDMPALEKLNVSYNLETTSLVLNKLPALRKLECYNCKLSSIEFDSLPALEDLRCDDNQLTSLDVRSLPLLKELQCQNNRLTSLELNNPELYIIESYNNSLSNLDISACPKLISLCENYPLQDVSEWGNEYKKIQGEGWSRITFDKTTLLRTDESLLLCTPTGVKAVLASGTSANVSWDAVSGVDGYQVSRATSADGPYTALGSVTTTNRVCTGLAAGKVYYFKVRAFTVVNGKRLYGSFSDPVSVSLVQPDAPSGVKADPYWASSVNVSWNAVSGADGYQVARGTSANGSFTEVGSVTETSRVCTGLKEGATYYFKVRAYKEIDGLRFYSPYSSVVSAAPLKPAAPTNLKVERISDETASVTWSKVIGADGYQLWRAREKDGEYMGVGYDWVVYGTYSWYDNYFKVRAYKNVNGTRIYGPYSSVIELKASIAPPSEISAVPASTTSVKVSWNEVEGVDGYVVWRGTELVGTDSPYLADAKALGSVTTPDRVCTGLTPGYKYYFQVCSYRRIDGIKRCGPRSTIVSAVPMSEVTLPSTPSEVKEEVVSSTSVKVSWNAVSGVDGYQVWRATEKYGSYTALGSVAATSRVCTGLKTREAYYFKVRAYKMVDGKRVYGAFSSVVSLSPDAPENVKATVSSATSVTVSWSKVNGATGYEVWRSEYWSASYVKLGSVTETSRKCPGLTTGKYYYFKVVAYKEVNGVKFYSKYSWDVYAKPQ